MVVILIAVLAGLLSLAPSPVEGQQPETLSLLGTPLYAPSLPKAERAKAESALAAARAAYEKAPSDPAAILAYERASLALGRVGDALEILTRGLEVTPTDPSLLLARGQDYIRIRKFEVAERDFRKAAASLPAARCGLAFAQYLSGDFPHAQESYAACGDAGVFGYLAARRAGLPTAARPTPSGPLPTPSTTLRLPGTVTSATKDDPQPIAAGYLEAIERLLEGDESGSRDRLKRIVEKNRRDWMEAAYIAAEADYAKLAKLKKKKR